MESADFNIIIKLIHHAGVPHGKDQLRIQLSRDNINENKCNIAIGFIYIKSVLYAYGVSLDLNKRKFTTTSSINFNINDFSNFSDNLKLLTTNLNENLVIGNSLAVLLHYEELLGTSLVEVVDIKLILSSIVWNKRFAFELNNSEKPVGIVKTNYELKNGDCIIINIVDNFFIIKLVDSNSKVKIIFNYSSIVQLKQFVYQHNIHIESKEIENKETIKIYQNVNDKVKIRFDFKINKFKYDNKGLLYTVPFWVAEKLITENSLDLEIIDLQNSDFSDLLKMKKDGILHSIGNKLEVKEFYDICYQILFDYWLKIHPNLIIKDDLQIDLIENYKISDSEADLIIKCSGVLKRRLCIKGRPYLYYHINSDILDISRDYLSLNDFISRKVNEQFGDLYEIFLEIESMIDSPDPEIITSTISRLIESNKLYWSIYGVLHSEFNFQLNSKTTTICETILDEFVLSLINNRNTEIEIQLDNNCYFNFILDLCNNLKLSNLFQFFNTDSFLSITINCKTHNDYIELPRELLFMPFKLLPYFKKIKERRKIIFKIDEFILNYVPKYNTISYERKYK